jgi:SAM-dependent methyltransferase
MHQQGGLRIVENRSEWRLYSQIYDIYYGSYQADIEYLERAWQPGWRSVLEIGAGTGRLLPFFQKQGVCKYVGLDTCAQMLDIASQRNLPPEFRLIDADLAQMNPRHEYDLILYAFNTANYILDASSFEKHLSACASALRPEGRVFLDLYIPFALRRSENGDYGLRERVVNKDSIYELYDERFYDPQPRIEERHHKSVEVQDGRVCAEVVFKTWRRYYPLDEIEAIAKHAGLRLQTVEEYGESHVEGMYVMLS